MNTKQLMMPSCKVGTCSACLTAHQLGDALVNISAGTTLTPSRVFELYLARTCPDALARAWQLRVSCRIIAPSKSDTRTSRWRPATRLHSELVHRIRSRGVNLHSYGITTLLQQWSANGACK